MRPNPVWELTLSVHCILSQSRVSTSRVILPLRRGFCRAERAAYNIRKSVLHYICRPQIGQVSRPPNQGTTVVAGKEGLLRLIPPLGIAGVISNKFHASKEAERIFAHCEHLLDGSGALCQNLRQAGFSRFLSQLDDKILALALQPDTWGERTRARVIAEVFSGLRGSPAEDASSRKSRNSQIL